MVRLESIFHCLLVAVVGFALANFAHADGFSEQQKKRVVEAIGKRLDKSAFAFGVDFSEWEEHLQSHRAAIDAAGSLHAFEQAVSAALAEFELSHLALFSPEFSKLQRNGQRTGVGVTVHPHEDGAFVSYVLRDSPGWDSGLRKGDKITAIDGQALVDIMQLAGDIGDVRSVSWTRNGETFSGAIQYRTFANSERSSMQWLNDEVAIIKIQSFQYRYYNAARINRFFREARRAKGVILDLRNNRGGLSFYSRHLASKIAPAKSDFARVAKRRHAKSLRSDPSLEDIAQRARVIRPLPFSRPFKGELVVLVDALSASAADIIPAFVQESGRGTVIGQKTTGALLLARPFRLPYGFRLYIPIGELLTPSGKRLEGNGLDPDISLDLEETANDQGIYALALSLIEENESDQTSSPE